MIVAGGSYVERCIAPPSEVLLGSGGRAALALQSCIETKFHTFFPDPEEIRLNFGKDVVAHRSDDALLFRYLHPLSQPELIGAVPRMPNRVAVAGAHVLRFGCVEGDFQVQADTAVYDPQGSGELFKANGSQAGSLAIILNEGELTRLVGHGPIEEAANRLLEIDSADVVVVKRGVSGSLLATRHKPPVAIPAFRTKVIGKIGSGDIFSAAFAYYWMAESWEPLEAATMASRQAARYVETRIVALDCDPLPAQAISCDPSRISVLIVSDLRTMADRWIAEEAMSALERLGAAHADLWEMSEGEIAAERMRDFNALLALPSRMGGRAMGAIQAARQVDLPYVIYCDDPLLRVEMDDDPFALHSDFAAAIYNVLWSADENTSFFRRH